MEGEQSQGQGNGEYAQLVNRRDVADERQELAAQ